MNAACAKTKAEQGSVLLVTLLLAFLFGGFLLFYLNLVRTQGTLVVRSQAWNAALASAEAGAEEALAQLNPGVGGGNIDPSANGWGSPAGGWYGPRTRNLSADSYYTVSYTDETHPTIYSTGYVTVPALSATLSRVLRVETVATPLYTAALAALTNIDMNGNGIFTDSFDSNDPKFSTNGRYDPARRKGNGDVASLTGIVNIGNADVRGDVLLGPGAIGVQTNNNAIITGQIKPDFNAEFADVVFPFNPFPVTKATANIDGITYDYIFLSTGDYSLPSTGSIYVGPGARVRIKITASSFSPDNIRVAGTGTSAGRLEIYMAGAEFNLKGPAIVDDERAGNFSYFGLPGNVAVVFAGNAAFTGTIYAPAADLTFGGGGVDPYDFVGSCMARSIKINGKYSFHFDEALQTNSIIRGYLARSWREL